MHEVQRAYRQARVLYSEEHFAEFFDKSGIINPLHQIIGKDILIGAATSYLLQWQQQETRSSKARIDKEIAVAHSAAKTLSASLRNLFDNAGVAGAFIETAGSLKDHVVQRHGADSDTFKILSQILPLDEQNEALRIDGLVNSISILGDLLGALEAEGRERTRKNRLTPLRYWAAPLMIYWFLVTGKLPTIGHYDREVAERGSTAISAFSFAAQIMDRKLSERLVVDAVQSVKAAMNSEEISAQMEASMMSGLALMLIILSGETYSPKDYIRAYLELPGGPSMDRAEFDDMWGKIALLNNTAESAQITRTKFLETFNRALQQNNSYQAEVAAVSE